ncbi:Uncharacterised protein family (UPF0158) [Bacillus sp. OV166]|uniref:UPF0158 family protein n=1 Tax=Bacillus sp. OV166 TaxID=1882763 RepID=UPI000A2AEDDE|nr:UPF0158 family protein [Bacillus sp. OV166]SMQ86947.1 Uncharacterised protein family (UPF0158) [Bacillus sp. OV166]
MNNPVKLQSIVEELEMQFEESRTFLSIKAGEIISVTSENLRAAEEEEPFDHLPEWEQEDRKVAIDVVENFENYKELPTKYEVNEYEIMEKFCLTVSDQSKQESLLRAIKEKGAFRRFKDKIIDFEMEEQWYSYRDECFKQIAIEWCQENKINFIK